ncbi:matrixin family metalloprotease [Sphaerisporangium corydalis]|uniref:Matrixin family metalloprotease n=1 Tax=Sphaerisporangium corydalis TaxID=1441875 RepID=A0ABV9EDM1_9ACTN|nr:matrixin family metalloprotease [Sphaerisporangium corydalis]
MLASAAALAAVTMVTTSAYADPGHDRPGSPSPAAPGTTDARELPAKAGSPETNLAAYPKLTDEQIAEKVAAERAERAKTPVDTTPIVDVTATESLPDGTVRVDTYTPAQGMAPEKLAASLRKEGKQNVKVTSHAPESHTKSDVGTAGADDCSYGQARTVTCPVSYWRNLGRGNPVVMFSDYSSAAWPTDAAVYKWNVVPNIDSWYRYGGHCDVLNDAFCVNVYSADYGDNGWWGRTTHYYIPPYYGAIIKAEVELNDHPNLTAAQHNSTVIHELGHVLGLGHNMWSGDVMYAYTPYRQDIGGENSAMLASIYSVYR